MARPVPTCKTCGQQHYNMLSCPKPQPPPDYLRRSDAPEGFRVSSRWGVNTRSVPIIYTLPPRPSHGVITGPDGSPYIPDV